MSTQTSNEPSLEEILSSIRRIISEDGPTTAQTAMNVTDAWPMALETVEADEDEEDVLVLTERVPMNGQTFLHAEPQAEVMAEAEPVLEAKVTPPMEAPVIAKPPTEPVVAEDTEVETAAAFEKLDAVTHASETSARSLLMPAPGRTLEDVIRELMQPMLKEWLDDNLPAIVQARVDEEIERISKRRVR